MSTFEWETCWEEIYLREGATEECATKFAQSNHAKANQTGTTETVRVALLRVVLEYKQYVTVFHARVVLLPVSFLDLPLVEQTFNCNIFVIDLNNVPILGAKIDIWNTIMYKAPNKNKDHSNT
jgi:hypothetical protein